MKNLFILFFVFACSSREGHSDSNPSIKEEPQSTQSELLVLIDTTQKAKENNFLLDGFYFQTNCECLINGDKDSLSIRLTKYFPSDSKLDTLKKNYLTNIYSLATEHDKYVTDIQSATINIIVNGSKVTQAMFTRYSTEHQFNGEQTIAGFIDSCQVSLSTKDYSRNSIISGSFSAILPFEFSLFSHSRKISGNFFCRLNQN
jgi:hypothetical protein